MSNKMIVNSDDNSLADSAMDTMQNLINSCPDPEDSEIKKLLAIHGTILQQVGMEILIRNRNTKRNHKQMQLGLKFMTGSREALKSAAAIIVRNPKPDSKPDSEPDSD